MKPALRALQIGQAIQGKVVEIFPENDLLISFGGDLVRVHNETRKPFRVDDVVTMIVKAIQPPRFQLLLDRREQRRQGKLDLSV